jgi:hypothetical protein
VWFGPIKTNLETSVPSGSAEIDVKGRIGDPNRDSLHRPLGTPFHYKIALKLDEAHGTGIRIEEAEKMR